MDCCFLGRHDHVCGSMMIRIVDSTSSHTLQKHVTSKVIFVIIRASYSCDSCQSTRLESALPKLMLLNVGGYHARVFKYTRCSTVSYV
jgi:hypothetical protein